MTPTAAVARFMRPMAVLVALATAAAALLVTASPAAADGEVATFHLKTGDNTTQTIKSTNVADPGAQFTTPANCRGTAPTCDVVRVYLEKDASPDALNFLRVELSWDNGPQPPDLALVVAGLGLASVNDLDMYVYDANGKDMKTGSATAAHIEVAGIIADTPYYDIVIADAGGATTQYTLNFIFSNEKFKAPFEVLDPASNGSAFTPPVDRSGDATPVSAVNSPPAPATSMADSFAQPAPGIAVAAAPLTPDSDFTGFRGAVDNQFAAPIFARPASSVTNAGKSPGVAEVLFWLVMFPLALAAGIFVLVRRRRSAALIR
jgi:hypothetical protein